MKWQQIAKIKINSEIAFSCKGLKERKRLLNIGINGRRVLKRVDCFQLALESSDGLL